VAQNTGLFSIACATCAARLTVKSTSAIGQVLACPRCGSMVLVEAPEGWTPPESATTQGPRRPRDPNDSQATLSRDFEDLGDLPASPAAVAVRTTARQAPAASSPSRPLLPDAQWESGAARDRRKIAIWIASLAAIGLVGGSLVIWLLVSMWSGGDSQIAKNSDVPGQGSESPDPNKKTPDDGKQTGPDAGAPKDDEVKADSVKDKESDTPPVLPPAAEGDGKSGDADSPPDPDVGENPNEEVKENDPKENDPKENDPLENAESAIDSSPPPEENPVDEGASGLIESLMPFQGLIGDPGSGMGLEGVAEARLDTQLGIGEVLVRRPKPLETDFVAAVAEVWPEIEFRQIPLSVLMNRMNELTGVPVQFEPESLSLGLANPGQIVSVKQSGVDMVQVINSALQGTELVAEADGEKNVVLIRHKSMAEVLERKIPLEATLTGDEAANEKLLLMLRTLTGPGLWTNDGGVSKLSIVGSDLVVESPGSLHARLQRIVQRLHAAARIKADPADAAAADALRTDWSVLHESLQVPCVWNEDQLFVAGTMANEIAGRESINLVFDWYSLGQENWNPATEMPWPGAGKTREQALAVLTESMATAWVVSGPGVVEFTTRHQYRNRTRYEVYACGKVLDRMSVDQLMELLRGQLQAELRKTEAWSRVEYCEQANCIVARLPDPLQIRLENIMKRLVGQ
jgi:DNA-directed RNA polymerase subunit RPC12/RpoP